jgi:hypothetical protein
MLFSNMAHNKSLPHDIQIADNWHHELHTTKATTMLMMMMMMMMLTHKGHL